VDELRGVRNMHGMAGPIGKVLKTLRQRTDTSVADVARALKKTKSTYQYYEDDYKKTSLPRELEIPLVDFFTSHGMDSTEVLAILHSGMDQDEKSDSRLRKPPEASKNTVDYQGVRPANLPPPSNGYNIPHDIPVYGTAAGSLGDGAVQLVPGAINYLSRPPGIAHERDVYGLFIEGESMIPRFHPGDPIWVSVHRPVRIDDYVIIQEQRGEHEPIMVYVKMLTRRTGKTLFVRQHNPDCIIEIPMKNVKDIHRILTTAELMGV
tara:strand:+ start:32467 stop:33258 length:792 start_codon:yes stop_codon:yes gene_type:complete